MRTVLVANRAEIACRVIRAVREEGLVAVLAASTPDLTSYAARLTDRVVELPGARARDTYLDAAALLDAAARAGADAIHPGYGFLSENAAFARAVVEAGLTWIGPDPDTIDLMGNKAAAIVAARAAGVPTVPGSTGPGSAGPGSAGPGSAALADVDQALAAASGLGYPLAVKASAGGGGRGIRVVADAAALAEQWPVAAAEAASAFGDPTLYLERYVEHARHIEVQVFGDGRDVVHLHERDCSVQRRHQKLLEECPAPNLPDDVRAGLHEAAVRLAAAVRYRGAGTVEFLYDTATHEFFFIEMNTRIQVEHPITETLLGVDLVREQLRVAAGQPLSFDQAGLVPRGHVVEVRINAEDPARGFFPSPGTVTELVWPAGPGVRVDAGFTAGDTVLPYYDSLMGKVVVVDTDRDAALVRARRALAELHVTGVHTTGAYLADVLGSAPVRTATHDTRVLDLLDHDPSPSEGHP